MHTDTHHTNIYHFDLSFCCWFPQVQQQQQQFQRSPQSRGGVIAKNDVQVVAPARLTVFAMPRFYTAPVPWTRVKLPAMPNGDEAIQELAIATATARVNRQLRPLNAAIEVCCLMTNSRCCCSCSDQLETIHSNPVQNNTLSNSTLNNARKLFRWDFRKRMLAYVKLPTWWSCLNQQVGRH